MSETASARKHIPPPAGVVARRQLLWLVEDDVAFASSIQLGCRSIKTASHIQCLHLEGFDALKQALGQQHPEIIVLDLHLGRHDSIQVMEYLLAAGCQSSIVLISGCDSRVLRFSERIGLDIGLKIIGGLSKPFNSRNLLDFISQQFHGDPILNSETLHDALNKGQITPFFQPIIRLADRQPVGAEALARWLHPECGFIPPLDFIPLAEQSGLMETLTSQILLNVTNKADMLHRQGKSLSLSVNVSASSLHDPDFADRLIAMVAQHHLPPERIKIEITESIAVGATESITRLLTRLRINGFSLSIDDFGTGHSSLTSLYRLPFSELKIDKSFVLPMLENPDALAIVRALIDLAHNLGLTAIAEGVETAALHDRLVDLGCDYAQGYFYAKPLTGKDFIDWLG